MSRKVKFAAPFSTKQQTFSKVANPTAMEMATPGSSLASGSKMRKKNSSGSSFITSSQTGVISMAVTVALVP